MSVVEAWLTQKLSHLDAKEFCKSKRRVVPEVMSSQLKVTHFNVPLATGVGNALFAQPRSDTLTLKRPFVILVHGFGADCTYPMWHWIHELVKSNMSVLTIDWDGHGPSPSSFLDFQLVTRTLPLLLQKLYAQPGNVTLEAAQSAPPCYIMGHGAGGALALLAAARPEFKSIIQGIALVSPALVAQQSIESRRDLFLSLRPGALAKDTLGRVKYFGFSGVFPAFRSYQTRHCPVRMKLGINPEEQYRVFSEETFTNRNVLQQIAIPVLWLHGTQDSVVPYQAVKKILDQLPQDILRSQPLEGKGYMQTAMSPQTASMAVRYFNEICL